MNRLEIEDGFSYFVFCARAQNHGVKLRFWAIVIACQKERVTDGVPCRRWAGE